MAAAPWVPEWATVAIAPVTDEPDVPDDNPMDCSRSTRRRSADRQSVLLLVAEFVIILIDRSKSVVRCPRAPRVWKTTYSITT